MIDFRSFLQSKFSQNDQNKGLSLYNDGSVHFLEMDDSIFGILRYEFAVNSQSYYESEYNVIIEVVNEKKIAIDCNCMQFINNDKCKHVAAALIYLNLEKPKQINIPKVEIKLKTVETEKFFTFGYSNLSEHNILRNVTAKQRNEINNLIFTDKISIIEEKTDKTAVGIVNDIKVILRKRKDLIESYCSSCTKTNCIHVNAFANYLIKTTANPYYLDSLIDKDAVLNPILKEYGFDKNDPEYELFKLKTDRHNPIVEVPGNLILKLENNAFLKSLIVEKEPFMPSPIINKFIISLKSQSAFPGLSADIYNYEDNKIGKKLYLDDITKIKPQVTEFLYLFEYEGICKLVGHDLSRMYYRLSLEEILSVGKRKNKVISTLLDFYKFKIDEFNSTEFYYNTTSKKPKQSDLIKIAFQEKFFDIKFTTGIDNKLIVLELWILIGDKAYSYSEFIPFANIFLLKGSHFYAAKNLEVVNIITNFGSKSELKFPIIHKGKIYKEVLKPLSVIAKVDITPDLMPEFYEPSSFTKRIKLKEMEPNYLMFEPIVRYDDFELAVSDLNTDIVHEGKVLELKRDWQKEKAFKEEVEEAHTIFKTQSNQEFYYLTHSMALENGWFFKTISYFKEKEIETFGQKNLKKFNFNTHKAKFEIKGGSGIDWFDLQVSVSYGDQVVPLKLLKQALINNQEFVLLGDGSLGMIPEEWLNKLKPLVKIGQISGDDTLKVSKIHFTILSEFNEHITDQKILAELEEKKKLLEKIDEDKPILLTPKNIKAKLRPYQISGFNWLNQLHEIKWGGCLADDMGLGKTLQSLTFIQQQFNQNKALKVLVVCPTSLIYNWTAEIEKFTKGIKYTVYHGLARELDESPNIIITSYGTLRNDIKKLKEITFDIAFLDESQAIKNPTSLVNKAVALINTQSKFILSGTPIQNNTYDLYAQLNFINPGLLGTQEYFKTEFATPIDKYGEKDKSELLRKMVSPFILRRTKEQVASDLPDKIETVLYYDMNKSQRIAYDSVKEEYRNKILGKIEEVGVMKSTFLILEGLNKLRQICDCPSLLSGESKYKSDSVKLDELTREITENSSNHKILIFSQFLGMLDLIKNRFEEMGVNYVYLDGSTPSIERKNLVDKFNNQAEIQVFLISLKAGGVGLNLTAADYVYIVDPWWNPAVEAQAIDRTHRIGQKNKVFSYKLICKDSIEEKIVHMQEKKKSIAKELIADDSSFIKKLTKEDIEWLLK